MAYKTERLRGLILLQSVGLASAAALGAGWRDAPRLLTLSLCCGLLLLAWQWRSSGRLRRLERWERAASSPPPPPASTVHPPEIRLEHAPVALFRLSGERAEPLNARARKLTAPGNSCDPAALYRQLQEQAGERRWIRFETERGVERALASASSLVIEGKPERLLALLPLESELEAETLRAWQQLVHVLTHEIMNSLTPVASLSRSAAGMLEDAPALPMELREELELAFAAISRRADSLADFVTSYRSLSAVPEPSPEIVDLSELFERLQALTAPAWRARGGQAVFSVEPLSLELKADGGQLEQALINLIKNAYEATAQQEDARLTVSANLARGGRLRLEVSDNGPGVPDDKVDQIFTPFYSTKAKGRGIGLALVRQLVNNNGGTVRYARSLSGGARLILTF
ncbi:sensor histidine kinase [Chromobacterium paludis]|uniref:histidine kinase n=1 Tax=Chromobacterium paludis TaxID=2605945 RepID=A0A5C1DF14_9NEIS|nr:sensor histidine kinase [Chromobacterium paludis]QEL54218.1 sensor histidine kinase [Chromobacterium paludis]